MAKKIVRWTEFHNYEAEIEIPDGLDPKEQFDWVMYNPDEWGFRRGRREP